MMKQIILSILILTSFTLVTANTVKAEINKIIVDDKENDVYLNFEEQNQSRPNIDISQITCEQKGRHIDLSLKLIDGGKIQESDFLSYSIELMTTKDIYDGYFGVNLETQEQEFECSILDKTIDCDCSGVNTDTLTISFNLPDEKEKIITISAFAMEATNITSQSADQYVDFANQDFYGEETVLQINAGTNYTGKVGDTIKFSGTLENGTASDYEWIWYIETANEYMYGQNPSKTFKFPGVYTGTLFVFNSQGDYGTDSFMVNISSAGGSGGNNGGKDGGTPGFEIITLIAAIAILFFVVRKK